MAMTRRPSMRVPSSSNSGIHPASPTLNGTTTMNERARVMSKHPARPDDGENGETSDGSLFRIVGAVSELLGIVAIRDVLHVEVGLELGRGDLEFLGDADVEREKWVNPLRVRFSEHGLVHAAARVVIRADDGRPRVTRRCSSAGAHVEASAEIVSRERRQDVRLIEVEETPLFVGAVEAFGAKDGVRDPTEETVAELAAHEKLRAVRTPFPGPDERLGDERRRQWVTNREL